LHPHLACLPCSSRTLVTKIYTPPKPVLMIFGSGYWLICRNKCGTAQPTSPAPRTTSYAFSWSFETPIGSKVLIATQPYSLLYRKTPARDASRGVRWRTFSRKFVAIRATPRMTTAIGFISETEQKLLNPILNAVADCNDLRKWLTAAVISPSVSASLGMGCRAVMATKGFLQQMNISTSEPLQAKLSTGLQSFVPFLGQ
jgi:hypothetical protein